MKVFYNLTEILKEFDNCRLHSFLVDLNFEQILKVSGFTSKFSGAVVIVLEVGSI